MNLLHASSVFIYWRQQTIIQHGRIAAANNNEPEERRTWQKECKAFIFTRISSVKFINQSIWNQFVYWRFVPHMFSEVWCRWGSHVRKRNCFLNFLRICSHCNTHSIALTLKRIVYKGKKCHIPLYYQVYTKINFMQATLNMLPNVREYMIKCLFSKIHAWLTPYSTYIELRL